MSTDNDDEKEPHSFQIFWAAWQMPYEEFEDKNELTNRMTTVQELLAKNLADRMIAKGCVDMELEVKAKNEEEPHYLFTAKAVIANPHVVVSEDIQTFNRVMEYAEVAGFLSEEEQDHFHNVMDRMRPKPITLN